MRDFIEAIWGIRESRFLGDVGVGALVYVAGSTAVQLTPLAWGQMTLVILAVAAFALSASTSLVPAKNAPNV